MRLVAALAVGSAIAASAQDSILHSDVPLLTEDLHPYSISGEDEFGCAGSLALGEWDISYPPDPKTTGRTDDNEVVSLGNYGVFHCAYRIGFAEDWEDVANTSRELAFAAKLGTTSTPRGERDLWALQIGLRPGSDYVLLASDSTDAGIVSSFERLPVICPRGWMREGPTIDIFITDYCVVDSERDLRRLAKRMATQDPIAIWTQSSSEDSDPNASDPSTSDPSTSDKDPT